MKISIGLKEKEIINDSDFYYLKSYIHKASEKVLQIE